MSIEAMAFPNPAGSVKLTLGRLECTGSGKIIKAILEGGIIQILEGGFVESTPQSRMPVEDMAFPSPPGSVKLTVGRLECTGSGKIKSLLEGGIIQILHV